MYMAQKAKKKSKLRHAEYYDMQKTFDSLYADSKSGEVFGHLMDIISAPSNIKLAFRNIKGNDGSHTAGTDGRTIESLAVMPEDKFVKLIQKQFRRYEPKAVKRVEIPKPNGKMRFAALQSLQPDILVVVAYGRILPDELLAAAPLGAINVHGSLLPKYRGAAPIQWAVLNGDAVTGVSTMYLDREMDTGDVIYAEQTPVGEFETAGELFDRLAVMGADLLVRTLRDVDAGVAPRTPQDHSAATYTRPLTRDDSPIDWDQSPRAIIKHICGLEPWPVATAELGGQTFKIHAADYSDRTTRKAPGTIVAAGKDGVTVACADGQTVRITQLQAPGKKRMSAADYLLGHTLPVEG